RALVVEQSGTLVAALPLFRRRLKGLVPVAGLTNNHWSLCGDLLLDEKASDPSGNVSAILDVLAAAAGKSPEALWWFEGIDCQTSRWQAWIAALERAGLTCDARPIGDVALIDAQDGWAAFTA